MKEYKYYIEMKYVLGDRVQEIKQENIMTLIVHNDYIKKNMPKVFVTGMLDKNLIDDMIVNASKGTITLSIYKYISNASSIIKELYFRNTFSYFVDGDINYNKEIDYLGENKERKDVLQKFSFGLMCKESIDNNNKTYNATVVNSTMINIVNACTKHMPMLIEPFTYNDTIPQLVVPPLESVSKTLAFLNNVKVFYDTPYIYFLDFDCTYLVSANGKPTAKKGEKYQTVKFTIHKKTDPDGLRPGMDEDANNKCYTIPISVADSNYTIDKNKEKGFNNIVSILDSSKNKSPEVGATSLNKAISAVNSVTSKINSIINNNLSSIMTLPNDIIKSKQRSSALMTTINSEVPTSQANVSTILTEIDKISVVSTPNEDGTTTTTKSTEYDGIVTTIKESNSSLVESFENVQGLDSSVTSITTPLQNCFNNITDIKGGINGVNAINISDNTNTISKYIKNSKSDMNTIAPLKNELDFKVGHANNIESQIDSIISAVSGNSTLSSNTTISTALSALKSSKSLINNKNTLHNSSITSLLKAPTNIDSIISKVSPSISSLTGVSTDLKGKFTNIDNVSSSLSSIKKNLFSSIGNVNDSLKGLSMDSLGDLKGDINKFKDLSNIGLLGVPKFESKLNFDTASDEKEKSMIIRVLNDNPNMVKNVKANIEMNVSQLSINKNDLDASVFTPNKEYIIKNYDVHSDKDGHFVLKDKKEVYMREGDHFNLNLMLQFAIAPNTTKSGSTVTSASNVTSTNETVNPETTKGTTK